MIPARVIALSCLVGAVMLALLSLDQRVSIMSDPEHDLPILAEPVWHPIRPSDPAMCLTASSVDGRSGFPVYTPCAPPVSSSTVTSFTIAPTSSNVFITSPTTTGGTHVAR